MSSHVLTLESDAKTIELTRDYLRMKIKSEALEKLKETTKSDPTMHEAVLTLIDWARYPIIPISEITQVSMEVVPSPPGFGEWMKIVVTTAYHAGHRTYELRLNPNDAQKVVSQLKDMLRLGF